jgi:aspartyl/asparaginyl-tRNA synthetase
MTIDLLGDLKRTDYCGDLHKEDADRDVILLGWVQRRRDLGGLIFIELRDRQGIVQVVFNPEVSREAHEKAQSLRSEYVIGLKGKVVLRPEGTVNPKLSTGEIEILSQEVKILNVSKTPPFLIEDEEEVAENVRLKYRTSTKTVASAKFDLAPSRRERSQITDRWTEVGKYRKSTQGARIFWSHRLNRFTALPPAAL